MAVRIALVGLGNWGRNHLRVWGSLPGTELVAACDTDPSKGDLVRSVSPGTAFTTSFEEALKGVDAAVVATDAATHYSLGKTALESGRHLLVEKPLALRPEEAEELVELARTKGLVLMVGHILLYHQAVRKLAALVGGGGLGTPLYLYSQRTNLGVIRQDENVVWSLAPHDISVFDHLLGSPARAAQGVGKCMVTEGVEDVAFFTLEYPGSVLAHCHVSWLDPHKVRRLTLVGSEKMALFDDMSPDAKLTIYDSTTDPPPARQPELPPGAVSVRYGDIHVPVLQPAEPLADEAAHFVSCIENGGKPLTDGESGLAVVRTLEAVTRSLQMGGERVEVA